MFRNGWRCERYRWHRKAHLVGGLEADLSWDDKRLDALNKRERDERAETAERVLTQAVEVIEAYADPECWHDGACELSAGVPDNGERARAFLAAHTGERIRAFLAVFG